MGIDGRENPAYIPGDDTLYWKPAANGLTFGRKESCSAVMKTLLAILVLCVLVMVALVVAVVYMQHEVRDVRADYHKSEAVSGDSDDVMTTPKPNSDVCLTKACVKAAADIIRSIDEEVHPCDNFYDFACGGWLKSRVIPNDKSWISNFGELRDDVQIKVKAILDQIGEGDSDERMKAKNFYEACVDEDVLNDRGDQIFKDFLKEEIGDWPVISDNWSEATFNLTDLLIKVRRYGMSVIAYSGAAMDDKNPDLRRLTIDQPPLGLPGRKYFLVPRNDTMLMAYEDYMYNIVNELGATDPATARQEIRDIVDFEIKLAQILVPSEQRRDNDALYNPMTLSELHGNYSQEYMDWPLFFRALTSPESIGITDMNDDEIVINRSPAYFDNYTDLLRETPNRTLSNYVFSRVALRYTPVLTRVYREYRQKFYQVLYGTKGEKPRTLSCATYTGSVMSDVVGRLFIEDHFDQDAKSEVLVMIENLQGAFDELVSELQWMDEETKSAAKNKNEYIKSKIGYSERILNDTYLEWIYSNITFANDQYFENVRGLHQWWFGNSMRQLRQPVDKGIWYMSPQTVNAYYSFMGNEIVFPAGILQPPFFSKHFPKFLNYGSMGVVIGHEITHGFDDSGRQYDKDGQLTQWWSDDAIAKFKVKAQCIVEQYGNFTYERAGLNVNGINTQGENIADNGGIKQSFRAYRNWVRQQGVEEKLLPGLERYSGDQLFFVSFAQTWCGLSREESAIEEIRAGVHSPGRFRATGSCQNSPDFAKAFNCPSTSYMNPPKKCQVW